MSYESTTPFINTGLDSDCLTVEFNRPDALNALRPEMLSEAARLVEQASDDPAVKVIVLCGAGRAFSAGVDLKVLQGIKPEGGIIGNVFDEPAARLAAAIRDSRRKGQLSSTSLTDSPRQRLRHAPGRSQAKFSDVQS